MTGVIYARYSSDSQRDESIDGQIRECQKYAEYHGIDIIEHYIDRAFSAKTDKRPAFQKMIKDSEKQKFDRIIVWKLDRFARNRYDSAMYKNKLKKNNVLVSSANEAEFLNVALFGKILKDWRLENPKATENIRDYATIQQLIVLSNLESMNAELIKQGMSQSERLLRLNKMAIEQLTALFGNPSVKRLESGKGGNDQ